MVATCSGGDTDTAGKSKAGVHSCTAAPNPTGECSKAQDARCPEFSASDLLLFRQAQLHFMHWINKAGSKQARIVACGGSDSVGGCLLHRRQRVHTCSLHVCWPLQVLARNLTDGRQKVLLRIAKKSAGLQRVLSPRKC